LLHYLKPRHYGLHIRGGQERFVDVEFCHRELFAYACEAYSRVVLHDERKSRISFAELWIGITILPAMQPLPGKNPIPKCLAVSALIPRSAR
jgi:hypothetical protein